MKFSYSAVWADVMALLRSHASLIATVAGVFLLLPALAVAYLLPPPEPKDLSQLVEQMTEYFRANWHWLLLEILVQMIGTIAILQLVFKRGITVGGVIGAAVSLLPFYFLASVAGGLIIGLGMLLLIIPGLYLFGRLAPLGAVIVAENRRNPVDSLSRTFALTKGNGWAVFGLVLLIAIGALVVMMVVNMLVGGILIFILGAELGRLIALIVGAATSAAVTTLFSLLYAAIYRHLTPSGAAAGAATAD